MEVIRKRKNLTSVGPNSGTTTTVRRRTINKHHQHRRRFNTVLIVMMFCAVLLLLFITYYKMGLNTDMNILTDTLTSPSPGTLDDDDNDVSNDNLGKSANDIKIGVSTFSSTKSSSPIHNHKNVYYPIYDMQQHILKSFDEELFKSKSIHDIYSKKKIQAWNKLDSIDAYLSTSTTNTINSSNGSNGSTGSDSSDGSHGSIDSNGSSDSRSVMVMTRKSYKGGRLNQQVNQDRAIVILDPFSSIMPRNHQPGMIIGIFDGHSTQGHVVAHYVQQKLPKVLTKEISSILKLNNNNNANDAALEEQQEQIKQIIIQSFNTTDTNIPSTYSMEAGCTTSLMIQIDKSTIYAANVGDSQSFIIRYHHDKKKADVVYVTMKHKPEDEMERKRIENAGGHVFIPKRKFQEHNGVKMDISSRVTIPNTSIGPVSLAMSRSMGDHDGREVGVISEPTVDILNIAELKMKLITSDTNENKGKGEQYDPDEVTLYAVSASDGLLDFITPHEIAERLAESFSLQTRGISGNANEKNRELMNACEDLILKASESWSKMGAKYRDDITIAVSQIQD